MKRLLPSAFWCALLCCQYASAQVLEPAFPGAVDLDSAINQAIQEDKIPGAVLLIGHNGGIVYRKAYGYRALLPSKEPMTPDTVFDIASLTKIVATTSAMMKLVDDGRVNVDAPVTAYLPEFQGGSSPITVRDLMTHVSGLRPDLDLDPPWSGYETGILKALIDKPTGPPEIKFVYSDINFILAGEIVHRLSGLSENEYVKKILLDPLGMSETGYLPSQAVLPRIAPTEMQLGQNGKQGVILRGVVHDPTARFMGGVAGHAGVFSTADDLGKFCQMILDGGDGLFRPATIRKFSTPQFTLPQPPPAQPVMRGLGWDIQSPYSGVRGDLFPLGSFGHTGFTGTSIWIDPFTRTYIVLLTNSVHPHQRKAITPLRGRVSTIVAASVGYGESRSRPVTHSVRTGLDVLEQDGFKVFRGKRVGLITNQTGLDRQGRRNVDIMRSAGVKVVALFSPEHGLAGVEDRPGLGDSIDKVTGIKVWSLYGKTLRPQPDALRGLDALVFDIQDVGVRFYTYESTMHYAMEEAAKAGLPFFVLDRPNPITGNHVEGPMLDDDKLSFTGSFPLPLRHGMTMGELARLMNDGMRPHADLRVIEMAGWHRSDWFDSTGLPWVNPSPNIRNLDEALLYPGIAMLEHSNNYSVGRGTDAPFEQIGATWINGFDFARVLSGLIVPGVRLYPVQFTPTASNFKGVSISGVRFVVTDREIFSSAQLGLAVAATLESLYPKRIAFEQSRDLIGSVGVMGALATGEDPTRPAQTGLEEFLEQRQKFLIYP
jgi:uncharacterized protein YbbC (DUF1343 family)/CubicO group peptidase (beta-lactamase class C family)